MIYLIWVDLLCLSYQSEFRESRTQNGAQNNRDSDQAPLCLSSMYDRLLHTTTTIVPVLHISMAKQLSGAVQVPRRCPGQLSGAVQDLIY